MKKSYKGFPIYALIIIGVLIATQLFSSSFSSQRGKKIEVSELYQYIESGSVDAVALKTTRHMCIRKRAVFRWHRFPMRRMTTVL